MSAGQHVGTDAIDALPDMSEQGRVSGDPLTS
jgi:hypothetical protein